jgi:tRNA pseudouridine13 synthase
LKELEKEQGDALAICNSVSSQLEELGGFPNYFGVQRFGAVRPITHVVGRHMIHGDLESAVHDFLCLTGDMEGEDAIEARKAYAESGKIAKALRDFPNKLSFEKVLLNHLLKAPEDFAGALDTLPGNLVTMFVHAYQSYIFNRILTLRMKSGLALNEPEPGDMVLKIDKHGLPDHDEWVEAKERNIPKLKELIGQQKAWVSAPLFGKKSEFAKGQPGEIEAKILEDEGIEQKDFILPEFKKLNLKGTRREILAPVKDLAFAPEGEDDIKFEFQLNKGCYATTLMREFMKADDLIKY